MIGYLLDPPTVTTMTPPKWAVLNALAELSPKHPTARELVSASHQDMNTVYAVVNYFTYLGWASQIHSAYPRRFHLTAHGEVEHRRLVSLNEWYLRVKPNWEKVLPWLPHPPLQRNVLSCLVAHGRLNSLQVAEHAAVGVSSAYDMVRRLHKGQWLVCSTANIGKVAVPQRFYSLRPELIEPTRQYLELFAHVTAPGQKG